MTGGRDTGEGQGSKKGKAKMTAAAWAKLTPKQKDKDYGGSRFMRVTSSDNQRGGGSKSGGKR